MVTLSLFSRPDCCVWVVCLFAHIPLGLSVLGCFHRDYIVDFLLCNRSLRQKLDGAFAIVNVYFKILEINDVKKALRKAKKKVYATIDLKALAARTLTVSVPRTVVVLPSSVLNTSST